MIKLVQPYEVAVTGEVLDPVTCFEGSRNSRTSRKGTFVGSRIDRSAPKMRVARLRTHKWGFQVLSRDASLGFVIFRPRRIFVLCEVFDPLLQTRKNVN